MTFDILFERYKAWCRKKSNEAKGCMESAGDFLAFVDSPDVWDAYKQYLHCWSNYHHSTDGISNFLFWYAIEYTE